MLYVVSTSSFFDLVKWAFRRVSDSCLCSTFLTLNFLSLYPGQHTPCHNLCKVYLVHYTPVESSSEGCTNMFLGLERGCIVVATLYLLKIVLVEDLIADMLYVVSTSSFFDLVKWAFWRVSDSCLCSTFLTLNFLSLYPGQHTPCHNLCKVYLVHYTPVESSSEGCTNMFLGLERGCIVVATLYLLKILWSASEVPLTLGIETMPFFWVGFGLVLDFWDISWSICLKVQSGYPQFFKEDLMSSSSVCTSSDSLMIP